MSSPSLRRRGPRSARIGGGPSARKGFGGRMLTLFKVAFAPGGLERFMARSPIPARASLRHDVRGIRFDFPRGSGGHPADRRPRGARPPPAPRGGHDPAPPRPP